jgi:hypothetical protein
VHLLEEFGKKTLLPTKKKQRRKKAKAMLHLKRIFRKIWL